MNPKQIKEKSDELVRMMRLYILGLTDAKMVKNILNCLFVDILLDETTKEIKEKNLTFQRGNFNCLLKEMEDM